MAFNYPFLSREFATVKRVPCVTVAVVNTGTPPVKHTHAHMDEWDEKSACLFFFCTHRSFGRRRAAGAEVSGGQQAICHCLLRRGVFQQGVKLVGSQLYADGNRRPAWIPPPGPQTL